jgi:hypothetical protein
MPNTEETDKVSIPMQNVHDRNIKKRKRRFVYYFLCILLSFVCIRIFLVLYSISQFDPKSYFISQLKYSTEKPDVVYVDASLENAFSPLNAQIVDGVINLYSVNENSNKRDFLAQIHLPVIELEKYKNIQFKGDLVFNNVDGGVLYSLYKNKHKIGIHFTGNLWFRFCLIKFKKSQTSEFLYNLPDNSKDKKDLFHVKKTVLKGRDDYVELKVQLDCLYPSIADFLYIQTENIQIEFGGDLPFTVDLSGQDIYRGRFLNPIEFSISVSKINYFILRNTLCKFLNGSKISLYTKEFKIPSCAKSKFPFKFYIHEKFNRKSISRIDKTTCVYKEPSIDVREVINNGNKITAQVDINPGCFPLISQETEFVFINIDKRFNFMFNGIPGATLRVNFKTQNEYIRMAVCLELNRLQDLVDVLLYQKGTLNMVSTTNTGFFKNFSLMWDGEMLRLNIERSYTILYNKNKKINKPVDRILDISHHISSNSDTILICSELSSAYQDDSKRFGFFYVPTFEINFNSEFCSAKLRVRENHFVVYDDLNFDGILRTDFYFYADPTFDFIRNIDNILNQELKISILENLKCEIIISQFVNINNSRSRDSCKLFDPKSVKLDYIDMLDLSTGKMTFSMQNMTSVYDNSMSGFVIRNYFSIARDHGLSLLIGARKYTGFKHLELLEDMKFVLIFADGVSSISVESCKFSVDLHSIDNLRGVILDKFKFGPSDKLFNNLVSQSFNHLFFNKGSASRQIISPIWLDGQIGTEIVTNFGKRIKFSIKLGLDYDVTRHFKLGEFNFGESELIFRSITDKKLCKICIRKEYNNQGTFIVLNADIMSHFYKESLAVFTYLHNGYIRDEINNYNPDTFMRLLRSFFVQLHVKDKIKPEEEVKNNLSTLNVFFNDLKHDPLHDEFITFNGSLIFHSQGFRDFIRYKLGSCVAMFFDMVPDKFIFNFKSSRFDLVSVVFYENKEKTKQFVFGQSHLHDVISSKSFNMLYDGGDTEVLKSNDLDINMTQFLVQESQNIDLYSIDINYNAKVKANDGKIYSIYSVSFEYETLDLFLQIFRDDTTTTKENSDTNPISSNFLEKCFYFGFNIQIFPINRLKLKVTGNNVVLYNNSFIENQKLDGYIRINLKGLSVAQSLFALSKTVWNYKDFEVELYTDDKKLLYKVRFKAEFIDATTILGLVQYTHDFLFLGYRWLLNCFFSASYTRRFVEIKYASANRKNSTEEDIGAPLVIEGFDFD